MFLSLKENKDFTKEIVDYIFINQNKSKSRCTCIEKDLSKIKQDINNIFFNDQKQCHFIKNEKIEFVSYGIFIKNEKYIQILFIFGNDKNIIKQYFSFLKNNYKNYRIDIVIPNENILNTILTDFVKEEVKTGIHLKLNKKIKNITKDKSYIVSNIKPHLIDEYKEIHQNENGYWNSKRILKEKKFKIIVCIYNNELVGYIDIYNAVLYNEIYDIFVLENIKNKKEVLKQMLLYVNDYFNNILFVSENDFYCDVFKEIGFIEEDNSKTYSFIL